MRELKFRRWSSTNNRFEYFKLDEWFNTDYYTLLSEADGPIEQYTGVKDNDGKEVWDGDFLSFFHEDSITDDGLIIGVVRCFTQLLPSFDVYIPSDYEFSPDSEYAGFESVCGVSNFFFEYDGDFCVVGNIHENSEL